MGVYTKSYIKTASDQQQLRPFQTPQLQGATEYYSLQKCSSQAFISLFSYKIINQHSSS